MAEINSKDIAESNCGQMSSEKVQLQKNYYVLNYCMSNA